MRKVFRGASRRDFQDLFLKVDLWKRRSCLFLSVNRSRYDAWKWLQLWRGPDLIQSQDILDGREKILKEPGFLMTSTGHLMNQTGDCPMCWPVVMWDDKSYCLELLSWVCCSQNEKKKAKSVIRYRHLRRNRDASVSFEVIDLKRNPVSSFMPPVNKHPCSWTLTHMHLSTSARIMEAIMWLSLHEEPSYA